MRANVTGTATFKRIEVTPLPEENEIEVIGYYTDGSQTPYRAVPVYVEEFEVELEGNGPLYLSADDDGWIYVHAADDGLYITSESDPDDIDLPNRD